MKSDNVPGLPGPYKKAQHRNPPEKGLRVQPFVIPDRTLGNCYSVELSILRTVCIAVVLVIKVNLFFARNVNKRANCRVVHYPVNPRQRWTAKQNAKKPNCFPSKVWLSVSRQIACVLPDCKCKSEVHDNGKQNANQPNDQHHK